MAAVNRPYTTFLANLVYVRGSDALQSPRRDAMDSGGRGGLHWEYARRLEENR